MRGHAVVTMHKVLLCRDMLWATYFVTTLIVCVILSDPGALICTNFCALCCQETSGRVSVCV